MWSPPRFSITTLTKGSSVDVECIIKFSGAQDIGIHPQKLHPAQVDDMLVQMDNARPHSAVLFQSKLACVWSQPSSTESDLNICDRCLFIRPQGCLKLQQLDGIESGAAALSVSCRKRPVKGVYQAARTLPSGDTVRKGLHYKLHSLVLRNFL